MEQEISWTAHKANEFSQFCYGLDDHYWMDLNIMYGRQVKIAARKSPCDGNTRTWYAPFDHIDRLRIAYLCATNEKSNIYFLFLWPCQPRVCRYKITNRRKFDGTFEIPGEAETCFKRVRNEWKMKVRLADQGLSSALLMSRIRFHSHTNGSLLGDISVFHWKCPSCEAHNQQNSWSSTLADARLIFGQTTIRMSVIIVQTPIRFSMVSPFAITHNAFRWFMTS